MSVSRKEIEPAVGPPGARVASLIDRYFQVRDNELCVGGFSASGLAEQFGTPIFVYDQGIILRKIQELRTRLPARFSLFYSMKA